MTSPERRDARTVGADLRTHAEALKPALAPFTSLPDLLNEAADLLGELDALRTQVRAHHEWIVWMEDENLDVPEWYCQVEKSRAFLAAGAAVPPEREA